MTSFLTRHWRALHVGLLVLGTLFLLVNDFHNNIWFDESYSVAIASKSFADIWSIGSNDVHPVLFYWALHVLYLVFGQNLVVYRLFTTAGIVAVAVLGYTHVRRDFGRRAGILFSFMVFATPYVATMAYDIRMYSWAMFTVMLCFIYALRIARAAKGGMRVSAHWWVVFALASLASAYLHYFAAMSAFIINVLLLVYLIVKRKQPCGEEMQGADVQGARNPQPQKADSVYMTGTAPAQMKRASSQGTRRIWVLIGLACLQVLAYVPWLLVVLHQVGMVSGFYWARFSTHTLLELSAYPFITSAITFARGGSYGMPLLVAVDVLIVVLLVASFVVLLYLAKRLWDDHRLIDIAKEEAQDGAQPQARVHAQSAPQSSAQSSAQPSAQLHQANAQPSAQLHQANAQPCQPNAQPCQPNAAVPFTGQAIVAGIVVYMGLLALGVVASLLMDSLIVYYRYLSVALGPALLAGVLVLTYIRKPWITWCYCVAALLLALINQGLFAYDNYNPENQVPLEEFQQTVQEQTDPTTQQQPLVLSADIGFEGVTALAYPDIAQTYLDWQPGTWGVAYQAYGPTLSIVKSWESVLDSYTGTFIVLGQTSDGSLPSDVKDLSMKPGVQQISTETFYRPYERTYFTIAVMQKG